LQNRAAPVLRKVSPPVWIAVLICGFMAVGLYVFTTTSLRAAQRKVSQQRVQELDQGLARYLLDMRRCPTTAADLVAGGYAGAVALKDAWKTPIALSCSDMGSFVRSAGRDKVFDTADDITSAGAARR
jgi:type II secretory pathway pseudopilin PulG